MQKQLGVQKLIRKETTLERISSVVKLFCREVCDLCHLVIWLSFPTSFPPAEITRVNLLSHLG